jgi:hypothetical protein
MNTSESERLRSDPLLAVFEDLGYWPLLHGDKWKEEKFDLTDLLGKIGNLFSNQVLISVTVSSDPKDTSRHTLHVSAAGYYIYYCGN